MPMGAKTSLKSDFALIETSVNSSPYVSFNIRTMLSSLLTTYPHVSFYVFFTQLDCLLILSIVSQFYFNQLSLICRLPVVSWPTIC